MRSAQHIFKQFKKTTNVKLAGIQLNISAVDHIVKHGVAGAVVECGVWKGGSMATMLHRLHEHGKIARDAYLFDTFAGMTEPTKIDMKHNGKNPAMDKFKEMQREGHNEWCYASLDQVTQTMQSTQYPDEKIYYVIGDVTQTAEQWSEQISSIAILRIDVDFYEATKACLEALYPKLAPNGIIIFDDYGIWKGAKQAIDEYFQDQNINLQHVNHIRWFQNEVENYD